MSGSILGRQFRISTWGESHGKAIGVVIDGCPAGLSLAEDDIQIYLDRRKPGTSRYATQRSEADRAEILSGVFEGRTTGTPISILIRNTDQHSKDYSELAGIYRPGHADFGYDAKYGFRDYRGGGRSSGRETAARVAGGAVAAKVLRELGITVQAYTSAIGPVQAASFDPDEISRNRLCMPDAAAAEEAARFLDSCIENQDSAGGVITCLVSGLPAGIGEPVFDKLDADLGKALLSIGAVKGIEIGDGFAAAAARGSQNNDAFYNKSGKTSKKTNHAGGILGGITDGSDVIIRAAFKPTPSISAAQQTVTSSGEDTTLCIKGRHDPVIVPRAVVVVECMTAITVLDALLCGMGSRMEYLKKIWT